MKDNNINNNQLDAFSEKVKSKLENHQLPLDDDIWNAIEKGIKAKKRLIVPTWLWIPISSVALIALILTFKPISEPTTLRAKIEIKTTDFRENETKKIVEQKIYQPKIVSRKSLLSLSLTSQKSQNQPIEFAVINPKAENNSVDSTTLSKEISTENIIEETATGDIHLDKVDTTTAKKKLQNFASNPPFQPSKMRNLKPKVKGNWVLAAAFSSNNGMSSSNDGLSSALGDTKNIVSVPTTYTSIMSPSDFTNITYSVPISFGLIIRKNIDKALSLESGLVYTYLQTKYNNTTANSPNAQLNLHYLGVPLNLIAKVWYNPKWEVYFSGGGMLEKGLWSVYQQHTYFATQVYTTTVETGIVGFQWSANAAIGTTYKFQKNLGIFFEPKVSYFFNNNQPASARTNQPTELGLVAGLRYEFK